MSDVDFLPLGQARPLEDTLSGVASIDPELTRSNYFDGRLLKARDLTRDQMYLDHRLREYGRAGGHGVVQGLDVSFATLAGERFDVTAGLAISRRGRTLELPPFQVEVSREALNSLNAGVGFQLDRGVYALVVTHREIPRRIAEIFPRSLTNEPVAQPDVFADAFQVGLTPLPLALPQDEDSYRVRAQLSTTLCPGDGFDNVLPEDGVVLGVVGVAENQILWFDQQLLRRDVGENDDAYRPNRHLRRAFDALSADIVAQRPGAQGAHHATEYFSTLPPAGTLPVSTIDVQQATQNYFPAAFRVSIAPILASDVALAAAEALALPRLDLADEEPVEILVLVPLSANRFARFEGQLAVREGSRLERLDPLRLRRRRAATSHPAALWQSLLDARESDTLTFVRRTTMVAETSVAAIRLAEGVDPPDAGPAAAPVADTTLETLDALALFDGQLGMAALSRLRPAQVQAERNAQNQLLRTLGSRPRALFNLVQALILIDRRYDPAIWRTLRGVLETDNGDVLVKLLASNPGVSTSTLINDNRADLGLGGNGFEAVIRTLLQADAP